MPEKVTVALGAQVVLVAEAQDSDDVPVGGVRIGWRAQDADGQDAPISSGGEFVARLPGVYQIIASGAGLEAATELTVRDPDRRSVAPLPAEDVGVGSKWNDRNAASAFAPVNRVGRPFGPFAAALQGLSWIGARRDQLSEAVTVGSANYTISAPVVRLEGRGMDLQLDLTYNSRLWNRSGDQVEFDIDQGWPAPGWSLGFGRIMRLGKQGSMLVDANGTRHPYEVVRMAGYDPRRLEFTGRTTDGSFIDYRHIDDVTGGFQYARAQYPDGRTVEYTAHGHDHVIPGIDVVVPSWGVLFPTRITDANGNVITIAYRNNVGPEIDTIVDTLGRTIKFHYDTDGSQQLTAITGPGLDGGRRTLVRLNWVQLQLQAAFAGLQVLRRDPYDPFAVPADPFAMRAIYYPGTATGYWFGDPGTYSAYGMATRVTRHRGMGFDNAPLTRAGAISAGTMTHQRSYDYPLVTDSTLTDVPTYTTMTETWEGADSPAAVTRFAFQPEASPRRGEVTYPNGTRTVTLAYNRPGQFDDGLAYQQEIFDGGQLVQLTTHVWQQGDYRSPRLTRVETTRQRSLMTATEYEYGPYNRLMEVRELDFGGTALLRRTHTEYEQDPGYVERHILALPTAVEVFAGSDLAPTARTEYVYDGQPLRDTPGVAGHAQTHNPYAPRVWVPPYDELECYETQRGVVRCTTIHHDGYSTTEYDSRTDFRGNATEIRRYADPAQLLDPVTERRTYDISGNLVVAESGRYERLVYEYSLATQYAYPERQVRGSAQLVSAQIATSASYDFGTGLPRTRTDADGRSVQTSYEPTTLRPSLITWPTDATTTFDYDDQHLTVAATTRTPDGSLAGVRTIVRNGLDLIQQEQTLAGDLTAGQLDITENRYDALGRLSKQSRPYRSGQTPFFTEVFRDALGRITSTRAGDGSQTFAYYDEQTRPDDAPPAASGGHTTRLVDAWGRERWLSHNALGQMQVVVEPDPDGDGSVLAPGTAATFYKYNPLGQVTMITQRPPLPETRWFRYDGLGRLTHQALTERSPTLNDAGVYRGAQSGVRWSDVFAYTDSTRLAWQMDARGVQTIFDYGDDPLGRLGRIRYERTRTADPANPDPAVGAAPASSVSYEYVTSGDLTRLLRVTTDDAVEEYSYDDQGRPASTTLTLPDQPQLPYAVAYDYDSLDRLRGITYPAQYGLDGAPRRQIELRYDAASRPDLLTVDGVAHASNILYGPCGLVTAMTVGEESAQPVTEANACNPANGLLASQQVLRDSHPLLDLSYDYQRPGRPGITGQLVGTTDNLDDRRTTGYAYDAVGRLRQASGGTTGSPLWSQRYTYDRYGNRTEVAATGTAPDGNPIPQDGLTGLTVSTPYPNGFSRTDNRITSPGFAYDEAGNLTRAPRPGGGWQLYRYDAAGRLVQVTDDDGARLETHTYGADRRRIRTRHEPTGTQTCYVWHGTNAIAEYQQQDAEPRWSRALVYLGQRLLCTYTQDDRSDVLQNPGFESQTEPPTLLQGTGGGPSAASPWTVWNNSPADTTTQLLPSTRPGSNGQMLHVITTGGSNGIVQTFTPALDRADTGVWVFVVSGTVGLGIGDGGSTSPDAAVSTTVGQWEYLRAQNPRLKVNEFILYSVSDEGASYYVDDASVVNADAAPTQLLRYCHPDRLGTRLITAPDTQQTTEVLTLPYGTPLQGDAAAAGAPSFTSYDRSQLTALDYAINRHYSPQLGRFLQTDPLGAGEIRLGEPQNSNAYAYCQDDPVNRQDPLGLRWILKTIRPCASTNGEPLSCWEQSYWVDDLLPEPRSGGVGEGDGLGDGGGRGGGAGGVAGVQEAGLFGGFWSELSYWAMEAIISLSGPPMQQLPDLVEKLKMARQIVVAPPSLTGGEPPPIPPDPEGITLGGPLIILLAPGPIMRALEARGLLPTTGDRLYSQPTYY